MPRDEQLFHVKHFAAPKPAHDQQTDRTPTWVFSSWKLAARAAADAAPKMCGQEHQRRRRDSINSTRLPYGSRPRSAEFLPRLVGKPGHVGIIEVFRQQ